MCQLQGNKLSSETLEMCFQVKMSGSYRGHHGFKSLWHFISNGLTALVPLKRPARCNDTDALILQFSPAPCALLFCLQQILLTQIQMDLLEKKKKDRDFALKFFHLF